ncbi:ubiquinone/menaquinone biosynthesis C-methylase UbiE [Kribbella rubisoli]|uniref:Ubiquinone/menaquinone biosynthesis C-methylase UbiE n=1 Tax=Kribbella rubisoli TaxID=3075929 RepID=A0A4Q7X852_9ACTN|nr:class I SAM-dependent methyltransferase [Kribbella rubisoli]RZU19158.1 ubiquinone/menaquinone biosynthesis C-methylase UbiE [Kribbella rubisoli]
MSEWSRGGIYESYVGRWSRLVAKEFLDWLEQPAALGWLDVGCGTGALTSTILRAADPATVLGVDPSEGFIEYARQSIHDERASFDLRSAAELPDGPFDVVVSGLVLNFVPERVEALRRMREIGSTVAVYVWDYAEGMQVMRYFFDTMLALRPQDREHDEGVRFAFCTAEGLEGLFREAGFADVRTRAIDVPTVFTSFDDFWTPFLGGTGVAPVYLRGLEPADQDAMREGVRERLPIEADGSIKLTARAWAAIG